MELTDSVLHQLRYLAEQATAGEWEAVNNGVLYDINGAHECLLSEISQMISYINIKR